MEVLLGMIWLIAMMFFYGLMVLCCYCFIVDEGSSGGYKRPHDSHYSITHRARKNK